MAYTESQISDAISDEQIESQYEEEDVGRGMGALHHIRSRTRSRGHGDDNVIGWKYKDADDPYNWPAPKKAAITSLTGLLVINSTVGSSLPSMAVPKMAELWNVTSHEQMVLPISVYLIGYVAGPMIWGPLSEHLGRRNLTIITFICFSLFTMACGFSPSWPALLVFRLFCGLFGSSPIAIVAGILADMYNDARERGRAFSIFMVTTVFGPLLAPIISGFCSDTIGWRWTFWVAVMLCAVTLVALVAFLPETYGPILLHRRAIRMRKEDPSSRVIAPRELETTNMSHLFTVVLTRPIRMLFSEAIVSATCAYLALVYAIFYMSFQAFPIIFRDLYGLSTGVTGLCYLPIGGGAMLSLPIFWTWDHILSQAVAQGKPWTRREEFRRLPLALLGGPLFVVALFWLGWSAKADTSFVAPMIAGVPFGLGFMLIFMALLNYLTDAYDFFAASANAVASMCRSLLAVVLPLATTPMFASLKISGACSLLGGLSAGMCVIPIIFIWKGPSIRARSKFCIALTEKREHVARKLEEERLKLEREEAKEKGEEV
ncbi:Fungal trichothecene efflux pump (TRI12) [Geosmithia morbida]|uniref:Fungal trichothecene efflux pump (TRI12) n=1 Tax=Geosmithia morbida TaxID=1094350 RepID=A0A9P5D791_9HYPO|nr:Fungal trichothecene efflux pump (TRI12) [Geosmithia morbida]KAF4126391.1 Fungal trichothecene efflux pump (TRI12) [Geosmithia morbida]